MGAIDSVSRHKSRDRRMVLAWIWLGFTLALAGWWMLFGIEQIQTMRGLIDVNSPTPMASAESEIREQLHRQHRMLVSEGAVLMALLLGGGLWMISLIRNEIRRSQSLESFFAAFAHDLKTSLTSLRLQAESLQEELGDHRMSPSSHGEATLSTGSAETLNRLSQRLVAETGRVETQLENALMMASPHQAQLILEELNLLDVINSLKGFWPQLKLETQLVERVQAQVRGDRRAWEIIFKNVLANAARHGRATQVSFSFQRTTEEWQLLARDDGRGLDLSGVDAQEQRQVWERLGLSPHRATGRSGSGLGLFIVSTLVHRMGGTLSFPRQERGFALLMSFRESNEAVASSRPGDGR